MRKSTKATAGAALAGLLVLASLSPASAQTLTWKITPSPAIKGNAELHDVSCPSASFCVAAGLTGKAAHPDPLIESWNGTAWSVVHTPGAPGAQFWGVSCTSRSFCTAVGFTTLPDGSTLPLAEMWNGRRWSITTTPAGKSGQFTGVSCNSASACAAVGSEANGKGGLKNFAEEWNGSAWSIAATPATRGGDLGDLLSEVSCPSADDCTAVGGYGFDPNYPLIESWDGTKWSVMPSPKKAWGMLNEVSCASAVSCSAVGYYLDSASNGRPYALTWSGKRWSAAPASGPNGELQGVACVSAADCTAAGFYWRGGDGTAQSMIWTWNGRRWSGVSTPSPTKTQANQLYGVACPSARTCTAVGIIAPGNANTRNLIETGRAGA